MQTLDATTVVHQRYRIVRLIGRGVSGRVYQATDTRLQRVVALKQLTRLSSGRQRAFEREARILARLRHPGLPAVSDYFSDERGSFLVMDYVAGDDLAELLQRRGQPLSEELALRIADQLLQTLAYLHGQSPPVLHRAIKPGDIRLTSDGRAVLLDFGLASDTPPSPDGASLNPYARSLWYAAPEIIYRRPADARSDLYALGATLYFVLTYQRPTATGDRATAMLEGRADPLQPLHELNPQVSPEVGAILARAMALKPEARFPSALHMRRALRASGAGRRIWAEPAALPSPAGAQQPGGQLWRQSTASWVLAAAALLVAISLGALLLIVLLIARL